MEVWKLKQELESYDDKMEVSVDREHVYPNQNADYFLSDYQLKYAITKDFLLSLGIKDNERQNFIRYIPFEGNTLVVQVCVEPFHGKYRRIYVNKKVNLIDNDCNLFSEKWLFSIDFQYGMYVVKDFTGEHQNLLLDDGSLLSDTWYKTILPIDGLHFLVRNDEKKYNIIDRNGKPLCDTWYDMSLKYHEEVLLARKDNKDYLVTQDGELVPFDKFIKRKREPNHID
jgi:hypothetical protein